MISTNDSAVGAIPKPLPNIVLPVFLRVDVDGYELFPGRNENGLHHEFVPGVTVIAGINGIGKTTLLNIMLRLLLGPFNPQKVTPFEVGAKSHELVRWKKARRFFTARVTDDAEHAIASAEVAIGSHMIKIARRLKDLTITYLEYDYQELDPTELEFERVALDASNASTRYDFDFLVRYLVFFLEQRVPLFWNERGQIETFRILLCESHLADEFQQKQDKIQSKDSLYRNLYWQAGKREGDLRKRLANLDGASSLSAQAAALQESFKAYSERNRELIGKIEEASHDRSALRTKQLLTKIELEEARRAYEGLQQDYLASIFPDVDESARFVFGTLLSDKGCAVCGNRSDIGHQRLQNLLSRGQCPVCESLQNDQERYSIIEAPDRAQLAANATNMTRLQHAVADLEKQERFTENCLREFALEQSEVQLAMDRAASELERIRARLPATPEELKALQLQVEVDRDTLANMHAELERLYVEYSALVDEVTVRVTQISEDVRALFSHYAKSFMAESCHLGLSSYKDKVGELRQFVYPCFNVFMTSSTSPDRETVRTSEEDVSESQREFIDLAFRMALIAAVASKESRSMLVIETPEASLDAFFVDQAGELLRQFGKGDDPDGNVVIVSSNLARQNMIGALLGFTGADESQWPDEATVEKYLVNMLDECRPNAALRDHRDLYEAALEEATKSRLTSRDN